MRNEGEKKENEGENERKEGREGGKKTRENEFDLQGSSSKIRYWVGTVFCILKTRPCRGLLMCSVFSVTERVCDASRGWNPGVYDAKAFVFPPTISSHLLLER